jgi:sulfate permease, SulP family
LGANRADPGGNVSESLNVRGEAAGGLVSAAVAIPLAMGYGMFAFGAFGDSYFAAGALAGLITALVFGVACVVLGDPTTTVYAPRVISSFFLGALTYGLVHPGAPQIAAGGIPLVLAMVFAIVLLAGAFEALFGFVKLGSLIKFTPQPVMAGFQNAAALLLFLVQLGNVCGFDQNIGFTQVPAHWASIKPLSVIVAALTFAVMWNARKLIPKVPPMLTGFCFGCALYYVCRLVGLGALLGPVMAGASTSTLLQFSAFPYFARLDDTATLLAFAPTIVGGALALAIVASIDALLCTKLVTAPGEQRRDSDRILLRYGLANVASACCGGITCGINIGASIANRGFGGRSPVSVLINAAALLVASVLLFRWLGYIPRVALSAVIMVIAVQHFDVWSLRLIRRVRTAPRSLRVSTITDLVVVITVAVLSIVLNIVAAVFIGVAIAVVLFVFHMSRSVVRRSYRCDVIHSRKSRTATERTFLETAGSRILVMELQGALFFGTGETIAKRVDSELGHDSACVILDLRRLTELDSTGTGTLLEIKSDLARRRIGLLLAVGAGSTAMERLGEFGALASFAATEIFPDVDRAIERAEDDVLRTRSQNGGAELAAAEIGLFAGYPQGDIKAITTQMKRKTYAAGTVVFHEGEPSDDVLIVLKGTASAYLERANAASIRLATFSPGTVFGELALLDHGPRSASVVADSDLVCYALSRADYTELAEKSPSAAILFMAAIGRELSGRLRTANRTIHQLEV